MLALLYLLGFLSGIGAAFLVMLIKNARKRKAKGADEIELGFNNILNY